jgi:glutamate N-acetyltransferase/amino-acid N-acetyltransferase
MIMPNMATMLAFVATDAEIPKPLVQMLIADAVNKSFNRISVDGDTSTNDMVVLMANGISKILIEEWSDDFQIFKIALTDLCKKWQFQLLKTAKDKIYFSESRLSEIRN